MSYSSDTRARRPRLTELHYHRRLSQFLVTMAGSCCSVWIVHVGSGECAQCSSCNPNFAHPFLVSTGSFLRGLAKAQPAVRSPFIRRPRFPRSAQRQRNGGRPCFLPGYQTSERRSREESQASSRRRDRDGPKEEGGLGPAESDHRLSCITCMIIR